MSNFPSSSRYNPRESTYYPQQPTFDHLTHLEECVSATTRCAEVLQSGLEKLEPGIKDLPRLTKVLSNTHRYLVLPTTTIQTHKSLFSQTLTPQLETLLTRAESHLSTSQHKISRLEERLELMNSAKKEVIEGGTGLNSSDFGVSSHIDAELLDAQVEEAVGSKLDGIELQGLSIPQRRKVVMLRGKRERLEKELAGLRARGVEV